MLAFIGGTGLDSLSTLEDASAQPFATAYGREAPIVHRGRLGGRDVLFLARHGDGHRVPPHRINYRANIRALKLAGARDIVAVAAVGGINGHPPGSITLPHQLIDYTSGRDATFFDGTDAPVTHVDFTHPYDAGLRARCLRASARAGMVVGDRGVYAAVNGPRLETAAEIDRFERDGATIIGMTGMPEALLAREDGLRYAVVALVINHAAGRGDSAEAISETALVKVMNHGMVAVRALLAAIAQQSEADA